jgi:CarboxypepD_reg-like domain/TonB-dependent Receptor Plug Domain
MKVFYSLFPLLVLCMVSGMAQQHTISGFVKEEGSNEVLIGANVYDLRSMNGTVTNNYGFFSLTLPSDTIILVISYVGYEAYSDTVFLAGDMQMEVTLKPTHQLQEIEIKADRLEKLEESTQMSTISIPNRQIKSLPRFLGEVDVMKALQLLPGVQSGNEGTSGLYIRGGSPDQNLVLLDGVPVYNVSHLFGFFSVFNADAINSVKLIKGGFPARYGGRLASVLEINMKEGNQSGFHGEGSIGIIASKFTFEGPIVKNKGSFIVSARRTYIDILARPFINASFEDGGTAGYYFYDLNAKVNYKPGKKDRLFLSTYMGKDKFYFRETYKETGPGYEYSDAYGGGLKWGNITGVLRWNHQFSSKLFANLTFDYSKYNFDINSYEEYNTIENGKEDFESFNLKYFSGIEDFGARLDFDFIPAPSHFAKFGASIVRHAFKPGAIEYKLEETGTVPYDTAVYNSFVNAPEIRAYIEDDIKFSNRLKANVGLHASAFLLKDQTYYSFEPRIAARYLLNESMSLKASYAEMSQYIHLLSNNGIGLPTDLWVPATKKIKPQRSRQVALGLAKTLNEQFEVTIEGYYKWMENLIEYKDGASYLNTTVSWEDLVESGRGWSYGAEFFVQKKMGKTTGWMGYTLSWSNRQFDNLNFGKTFPYKFDRRHDFSIAVIHRFSKRVEISATWVYGTGNAISLPIAVYSGIDYIRNGINPDQKIFYYDERNGYRMQAYHRFDIGLSLFRQVKWGEIRWNFGLYNAYNRKNPFFIYYGYDYNTGKEAFRQVSIFPVLPSISFSFKF